MFVLAFACLLVGVHRERETKIARDQSELRAGPPPTTPRCSGPRVPSHEVHNVRSPDGIREPLCGTVDVDVGGSDATTYGWTEHVLVRRYDTGWSFLARTETSIKKVVALPNGALAALGPRNEIIDAGISDFPLDSPLTRFDAARASGLPAPPSPLECLRSTSSGTLRVVKRFSCTDRSFDGVVSFAPGGATMTRDTRSRVVTFGRAQREIERVIAALEHEEPPGFFPASARLTYECDGVKQSFIVEGLRARSITEIVATWH